MNNTHIAIELVKKSMLFPEKLKDFLISNVNSYSDNQINTIIQVLNNEKKELKKITQENEKAKLAFLQNFQKKVEIAAVQGKQLISRNIENREKVNEEALALELLTKI